MDNFKKTIPYLLFVGLFSKLAVLGTNSFNDFGILALSLGLLLFYEYKFSNKQLEKLEEKIKNLKESQELMSDKLGRTRDEMGGVKLSQTIRTPKSF